MGLRPVDDHLGRVHICDFDFDSLARRAVARTCTLTYTAFYNGDRISVKQFFKFSDCAAIFPRDLIQRRSLVQRRDRQQNATPN